MASSGSSGATHPISGTSMLSGLLRFGLRLWRQKDGIRISPDHVGLGMSRDQGPRLRLDDARCTGSGKLNSPAGPVKPHESIHATQRTLSLEPRSAMSLYSVGNEAKQPTSSEAK